MRSVHCLLKEKMYKIKMANTEEIIILNKNNIGKRKKNRRFNRSLLTQQRKN